MKDRLGVLAYLVTTLRSLSGYDSPRITIEGVKDAPEMEAWTGEALGVLIGNGRRFAAQGGTQADMEDGRFEIAVIRNMPAIDLMSEAVSHGLLGGNTEDVVRFQTTSLTVRVHDQEAIRFSLDGEIVQEGELSLDVRPGTVTVAVGDTYEPDPD